MCVIFRAGLKYNRGQQGPTGTTRGHQGPPGTTRGPVETDNVITSIKRAQHLNYIMFVYLFYFISAMLFITICS